MRCRGLVKGHDFSRADQVTRIGGALAPACSLFASNQLRQKNVPRATWLPASSVLLLTAVLAPSANCLRSDLYAPTATAVSREFFDPCLRLHWQLQTNPAHPEQPGRLVLVNPNNTLPGQPARSAKNQPSPAHSSPAPIIHAGDRVTVDQQTEVLHAHFQAVALEPALPGQRMKVRLSVGDHSARGLDATILTVLATTPGQARWQASEGTRP
jgi:hypothetical protein